MARQGNINVQSDDPVESANDVTATPEFQAALQREVQKAVAANFDAFQAKVRESAPQLTPPDVQGLNADSFQAIFRQMALSIAEVNDIGMGAHNARRPKFWPSAKNPGCACAMRSSPCASA